MSFKGAIITALVHLAPPSHHAEAKAMIEEVLSQDEHNATALMGKAYILRDHEQWKEASDLFQKVSSYLPDDSKELLRVREEQAWCAFHTTFDKIEVVHLVEVHATLQQSQERHLDSARCLWRIGRCEWLLQGKTLHQMHCAHN
jgi:superkiller protein 3